MAPTTTLGPDASGSQRQPSPTQRQQDAASDSDLDPAAFLKSVRELSEKREREDAERYRKLEEEVQRGREERAARRADRARSISPEKHNSVLSSPSTRPLSRTTTNASLVNSPPVLMTPPSASASREMAEARSDSLKRLTAATTDSEKPSPKLEEVPDFQGFGAIKRSSTTSQRSSASTTISSQPGAGANASVAPSATNLARSGTLSWQQRRPTSKLASSRPVSMAAVDTSASHSRGASVEEPEPSRDQIAASLSSRDPSWFKQTAERGVGSAAYRKSKDEAATAEGSPYASRRGLPGLSRETSIDFDHRSGSPTSESRASDLLSRKSQRESALSSGSRFSTASSYTSSKPDLRSLIAADEGQRRVSPSYTSSEQTSATSPEPVGPTRTSTMFNSPARAGLGISRSPSPTKGMGGFVQSAMMKRSDSQNKRWSAQPSTGVSRHNSVASGHSDLRGSTSMSNFESIAASPELAVKASSRPTSVSHNNLPGLTTTKLEDDVGSMNSLPSRHNRSKSVASFHSINEEGSRPVSPGSPTKRFSPNKSSWLESSLTKPESPKQLAPSKNSQPSWMADLAHRKAQRASGDSSPAAGAPHPAEIDLTKPLSRPGSPLKTSQSPFGPSVLKNRESREVVNSSPTASPSLRSRPFWAADKFDGPPTAASPPSGGRATGTDSTAKLDTPIELTPAPKLEKADEPAREPADPVKESRANEVKEHETPPTNATQAPDLSFKSADAPSAAAAETPSTPTRTIARSPAKSSRTSSPHKTQFTPETATKAPIDFRSQLKARPPPETKTNETPEFLSKFGKLRKTQPEKFVAPDVLKDNILRGKSGLATTGGPVKTERKDELKESLLSKKQDIKKAKEEGRDLPGQVHERKISSGAPPPPSKPEALAQRELLARSDSARSSASLERIREATPEALTKHKSMKSVSDEQASERAKSILVETKSQDSASKTVDTPSTVGSQPPSSKLAARFNPGLANILARGPPSSSPTKTETPALSTLSGHSTPSEQTNDAGQLQDMRKDRARGPKRRKNGAKSEAAVAPAAMEPGQVAIQSPIEGVPTMQSPKSVIAGIRSPPTPGSPNFSRPTPATPTTAQKSHFGSVPIQSMDGSLDTPEQVGKSKPQALPGSAASVLTAALKKTPTLDREAEHSGNPSTPSRSSTAGPVSDRPVAPAKSPALVSKLSMSFDTPAATTEEPVPEFKGFGSLKMSRVSQSSHMAEANKENTDEGSPAGKPSAAIWGRRPIQKSGPPAPIHFATKKDEEAAMRSAGLLASGSAKNGLGVSTNGTGDKNSTPPTSAGLPPKPVKPSRMVSGQLAESSPNKGPNSPKPIDEVPETEVGRLLKSALGIVPRFRGQLTLNTAAIIADQGAETEDVRNPRKTVSVVYPEGSTKVLPPQEEYTLFDESVFICTHYYTNLKPAKVAEVYIWAGETAFGTTIDAASVHAKRIARENSTTAVHTVRQGQEPPAFLQAFGGIVITRRGSQEAATKQYMLCGRKHLGHIVFDEVDFDVASLCHGFVYLISYPVTLQDTKLYLWKGSGCSTEELSGARLAAMDLSETGDIIEIDGGVEFPSFLKIFGPGTTKASIAKPSPLWQLKSQAPDRFRTRLFKIQRAETKTNLLTSLWNRRPSWNSLSPARTGSPAPEDIKVEAKEISPFTQSQLEADSLYLLDAHGHLYILIGVLFPSQIESVRRTLFAQALLFASDYATLVASMGDRVAFPQCEVLISGVPNEVKMLFRHWDDARGLWGTAGLMAGSDGVGEKGVRTVGLQECLTEVLRD